MRIGHPPTGLDTHFVVSQLAPRTDERQDRGSGALLAAARSNGEHELAYALAGFDAPVRVGYLFECEALNRQRLQFA